MNSFSAPADGGSVGIPLSIAVVATCPPRQCGIATFTDDVTVAIRGADPQIRTVWAAIDEPSSEHTYPPDVRWRIRQGDPASYAEAARRLNRADVDLVALQHEFGLYGIWGETFTDHLEPFLATLRKPLVTTFHTVLPSPSPSVRAAVQRLGYRSSAVVVMAETARRILVEKYGLPSGAIHVIPHGVPPVEPRGRTALKRQLGLGERTLISTFGLVDPRKGLEYMIEAMASVASRFPDVLYLIIGRTHPELVKKEGEAYRSTLAALIHERGISENVAFLDAYLELPQIIEYLLATDVYVTPYLDPNQITSGTLSYALGAGKAIISTPYLHALESLAGQRGILVGFRDETALAEAVLCILDDPRLKRTLERNAYEYGRVMAWPVVGGQLSRLYRAIAERDRPVVGTVPAGERDAAPLGVAISPSATKGNEPPYPAAAGMLLPLPAGRDGG